MAPVEGCKVTVLNTEVSMFGMRVLLALKEKGVEEYEYVEEDLSNKSALLLESNPVHRKIPVLIHEGRPVCESLIIVQYIDEAWPDLHGNDLLPKDPHQRALARFWADFVDKKFYEAGVRIIGLIEGESRNQAKKDLTECFVTLDMALRDVFGGGPYFGGDRIGFVDVAFAPAICWFEAYEAKLPKESQCPHLHAWLNRIVDYPSVKETLSIAPSYKVVEFACNLRRNILQA